MSTTKILIIIVVVLILLIYSQYYSKYSKGYNITQTYLDKINLDILYEKNPIIIYDCIKTPKQLLKTLFKFSYAFNKQYSINTTDVYVNKSKFGLLYLASDIDTHIMINLINPMYKKDFKDLQSKNGIITSKTKLTDTSIEYISIKLRPYQVLIIPSHWLLQLDNIETISSSVVYKIDLDDIFSKIYYMF
jgi:hypothetical protein